MLDGGDSENGGLLGNCTHGVDASHRVMLPIEWRPSDPDYVFTLIPWPVWKPTHVLALTPERWKELAGRIRTFSLVDEAAAELERAIAGTAQRVRLDKVGRVCLGESLRSALGIGKEATLVGRVDKFEIWNAPDWTAHVNNPSRLNQEMFKDKNI